MALSPKPKQPDAAAAAAWIGDAAVGPTKPEAPKPVALDPRAKPSKAFNLRLNDYELELLKRAAADEYCSQQAIAKRILFQALEAKYKQE